MSGKDILPCPACMYEPKRLHIMNTGQGQKWAYAMCPECGLAIEFRTRYLDQSGDACHDLAVDAWNETPRHWMLEAILLRSGLQRISDACGVDAVSAHWLRSEIASILTPAADT